MEFYADARAYIYIFLGKSTLSGKILHSPTFHYILLNGLQAPDISCIVADISVIGFA